MTENLPIVERHHFIHVYGQGTVMTLHVTRTIKSVKLQFQWQPPLKNLRELDEIGEDFIAWRDYFLGGSEGPHHGIFDFLLYQSCEAELSNLIEILPP